MTQTIGTTPSIARVTLLDAEGQVTTKLPEGVIPSWCTDQPGAFVLNVAIDGLSCAVSAPGDVGAVGTLTFTLGAITATASIAHESAAPAPAPAPSGPGVAVSATISFDAPVVAG